LRCVDDDEENYPDPGSQQLDSLRAMEESETRSGTDVREEDLLGGLDLNELCGLAENEDIRMYLDFVRRIEKASLEDDGMKMGPDDLERLRHPPQEKIDLNDPNLRLALDLFLATSNSSQETYNSVCKAIRRRYPEEELFSYDQIKRHVADLSGVIPLTHDMCINTCIAYTGQFSHLESCPYCNESRYDVIQLAATNGKAKEPRQQLHTMPIGPQLQALYRSEDGAQSMHYRDVCTKKILNELNLTNGNILSYKDFFHGGDYLEAIREGRIKEGDPVLMFSIDGAQLYRSKASDCWIYIWVIFNYDPAAGRYTKKHVLYGAIIPGPNKPKIIESFLFPGLHHLSAIQKEGLPIWDASRDVLFVSHPFLALVTADGPAMAYINGLVGHQGKNGCRLYCPLIGRRKPNGSHYYPTLLKPNDYNVEGCNHADVNPSSVAFEPFKNYEENLRILVESQNDAQYKKRRLQTGIVKPSIFLGLPRGRILSIPRCFGYDIMHLISLNIPDLLISLWRGTIDCDKDDDRNTWDWAVLRGNTWTAHGKAVASATPYLPGSFDRPPRNPAEKINSGYKAWEFLLYIFGLGPGLFYKILPQHYWKNYCKLVFAVRILHQYEISGQGLRAAYKAILEFVIEFEELYCQRQINRIHFVRPCLHTLIHVAPEVVRVGPGMIASQWTMERAIGDLSGEIRLPSNPYANLSQRAVRRCQVNALKAMVPDLEEPINLLPRGSQDLGDGYVLLRAQERYASCMTTLEAVALHTYYHTYEQDFSDGHQPKVFRWARLRLPTGQIARSTWKECKKPLTSVRMARNVKVRLCHIFDLIATLINLQLNIPGQLEKLAEVQYFFQVVINGEEKTVALVSLYTSPDQEVWNKSNQTLWVCYRQGDRALKVIDVKTITAVVSMVPLPSGPEGAFFLVEKPGLDVAHMGGQDETMTEE
jgi:hypothetical protein